MTIADRLSWWKGYKDVTTDKKWEDQICIQLGEKIFLISSPAAFPCSASLKVTEDESLLKGSDLLKAGLTHIAPEWLNKEFTLNIIRDQ